MSLDVSLQELNYTTLYMDMITHNLKPMAEEAGLATYLWCPGELGLTTANELIAPLTQGLARLRANPEHYRQFNPVDGLGNYDGLVAYVENYVRACERHAHATIAVSR